MYVAQCNSNTEPSVGASKPTSPVWFHVDDLSSAHVYLRMKPGMTLDDIGEDLLLDCAALVKANSIQGCKVRGVAWRGVARRGVACRDDDGPPFLCFRPCNETTVTGCALR